MRGEDGKVAELFHVEQAAFSFNNFACDEGFDVGSVGELRVSKVNGFI